MARNLAPQRAVFQFTHPGRGATRTQPHIDVEVRVSIHAPREGCDMREQNDFAERMWFQFTHPGRGATALSPRSPDDDRFQFTHPGRGATVWCKVAYYGADKQA